MKKVHTLFVLIVLLALSAGFVTGCDRDKKNNSTQSYPYGPNGGYGGGYGGQSNAPFKARALFTGNLQVVNNWVYREFLERDYCNFKKYDCKLIDGNPFVQLAFTDAHFYTAQTALGQIRFQFREDGYPSRQGGTALYTLAFRRRSPNGPLRGSMRDSDGPYDIGARVVYSIKGNPQMGGFRLEVHYDRELMLEGRLTLVR